MSQSGQNAAAGGSVIGGLLTAWGQHQQGQAERKAAEMNAEVAEQNASLSLQKAVEDDRKLRVQGAKFLGDMRSSYGASGVTAEGSVLDILKESASNIEHDAQTVKFNGEMRAMAFRNEARISRYRGENAERTGDMMASATLINTGAKAGESAAGAGG